MRLRLPVILLVTLLGAAMAWPMALAQSVPYHVDPSARDEAPDLSAVPAIRFLTSSDFPPFNFRSASGELIGFNVDLARAICDVLDVACTLQAWPWDQAADALADNQGDALIAGLAITSETAERFDFSDIYLMFPGRFVVPRSSGTGFDPQAAEGETISVRIGSAHDTFVRRLLPGAEIEGYETEIEALAAVSAGDANAYFGDAMRASFWLNENPQCCTFAPEAYFRTDLFGEGMAVAFPAGHSAVRRAVNWALVLLKRDGTLDELYLRWFPVSFY